MAKRNVDIVVKAHDQASRKFRQMGGSAKMLGRQLMQLKSMLLAGIGIYAVIRAVRGAVSEFMKFETQIAEVSTMLRGPAMRYLEAYREGIADLAAASGQATEGLSKGLYDILSASVAPAQAMLVLRAASVAATAGMTDAGQAADALTTVLNSYKMAALRAYEVSDILFKTVQRGKTTFPELASGIGMVASIAASAGLDLRELGAAIATMTRSGLKSDKAMTSLRSTMSVFLKPAAEAAAHARRFGIELDTATLRAEGLAGVLQKLKARGATEQDLAKIFPNVRALAGIMALSNDLKGLTRDIKEMKDSLGAAGEAHEKMASTASRSWKMAWERIKGFGRDVGGGLAWAPTKFVESATRRDRRAQAALRDQEAEWGRQKRMFDAQAAYNKTAEADTRARLAAMKEVISAQEAYLGYATLANQMETKALAARLEKEQQIVAIRQKERDATVASEKVFLKMLADQAAQRKEQAAFEAKVLAETQRRAEEAARKREARAAAEKRYEMTVGREIALVGKSEVERQIQQIKWRAKEWKEIAAAAAARAPKGEDPWGLMLLKRMRDVENWQREQIGRAEKDAADRARKPVGRTAMEIDQRLFARETAMRGRAPGQDRTLRLIRLAQEQKKLQEDQLNAAERTADGVERMEADRVQLVRVRF